MDFVPRNARASLGMMVVVALAVMFVTDGFITAVWESKALKNF